MYAENISPFTYKETKSEIKDFYETGILFNDQSSANILASYLHIRHSTPLNSTPFHSHSWCVREEILMRVFFFKTYVTLGLREERDFLDKSSNKVTGTNLYHVDHLSNEQFVVDSMSS
jgi:hypothetical protein